MLQNVRRVKNVRLADELSSLVFIKSKGMQPIKGKTTAVIVIIGPAKENHET